MQPQTLQVHLYRYGLAALSVTAAALLTHFLAGIGDSGITPLFFAAVLLSAWYGGLGPGLLSTVLSGMATAWLLLAPHGASFHAMQDHILRLLVFTIVAVLTSSLHAAMKRAAEASRKAREAAESASAAKSRFLAMVSHELRTPLSPVLMVAEMLEQDPSLPAGIRKDIQTIRRNVDLEIRLIEDLVDLTRISAGKLHLRQELLDVRDPLKAALEVCGGDLRDKGLDVTVDLTDEPCPVEGDPVRLQQIFWNLLRNAVKFSPPGGQIRISSAIAKCGSAAASGHAERSEGSLPSRCDETLRCDQGDGLKPSLYSQGCVESGNSEASPLHFPGSVIVQIADSGIGIDPPELSRIFNAFEQGDPDIQARFGGLGLGLAICQAMTEAHHGVIHAASPGKGHGATFTVTLPLATSKEAFRSEVPALTHGQ